MDLSRLQQQLSQPDLAPVTSWTPAFCGDLPLLIDSQGRWWYQQSEITRPGLIKLFASVLIEQEQEYFLQTPVEKVRIQVADAPFVILSCQWQEGPQGSELWFTTNLGDSVPLSAEYPLFLKQVADQHLPYLKLWRGLTARLHRNLYYQLLEEAQWLESDTVLRCELRSAGCCFVLAQASAI